MDYVPADLILPLTWESGIVTECAFGSHKAIKKDSYLYICIHKRTEKGTYDIENLLYRDTKGSLSEVKLADVPGFENVAPVVHTPFTQRMFVIDRLNIVNNVDATLPMGISVFANDIDQLKGVELKMCIRDRNRSGCAALSASSVTRRTAATFRSRPAVIPNGTFSVTR